MKRWLIAAGGGLLALTVVLTGVHTTGLAQEEASPATEEGLNEEEDFNIRDAYLEALAAELGITVEDLEAAMNNAQMQVIDRWAQEAKDRVESGEPVFPNLGGILGGFGEGFGIDLPFRELRPGSMTGPDVSIVVGPEMRGAELEGLAEFLGIANFVNLPDGRQALVRPERVRLAGNGEGMSAKIVEAIYLGQTVRYHLALQGEEGRPMVATVPFVGRTYATGDNVKVSWDAADLWPVVQ